MFVTSHEFDEDEMLEPENDASGAAKESTKPANPMKRWRERDNGQQAMNKREGVGRSQR
jgi:hypothetical protein